MNRFVRTVVCAALPLVWATGCRDFLKCDECESDPNNPTDATRDARLVAVQATQFSVWVGDIARTVAMWMQQMSGTGSQYQSQGTYNISEQSFDISFRSVYASGGLIDLRAIEAESQSLNDRVYLGVAQVWEAYVVGNAASIWGDLPYSQALAPGVAAPQLDPQQNVYAAVQALLDQAIANLESGEGAGPGAADLVYGGDAASWAAAAHTLKARFYMHWVEAQLAGGNAASAAQAACGGDCVANVLAQVPSGIADPANDLRASFRDTPGERNPWYQFINEARPGQINAGEFLVNLLQSRNDPRLTEYFEPGPSAGTEIIGAPPGATFSDTWAQINAATLLTPDYPQPLVTWAENQLLWAEAAYRLGATGDAVAHVQAVKDQYGSTVSTPPSGPELLQEIMLEKYIALFQNNEVWNDYKRTCIPDLTPAAGLAAIPGRFFYGLNERQTNPNIPSVADQVARARNTNDPNPCP